MGGELGAVRGDGSPRFAVLALQDPGTADAPGTPLQRVQIVKGWIDADGAAARAVFDVAGDADNGADVDPATCDPRGAGSDALCAVWKDPEFDADAARLLLRARAREPDLPLEHVRLQGRRRRSPRHRLRRTRPRPPTPPSPTAA